jgi:hypothetical protein
MIRYLIRTTTVEWARLCYTNMFTILYGWFIQTVVRLSLLERERVNSLENVRIIYSTPLFAALSTTLDYGSCRTTLDGCRSGDSGDSVVFGDGIFPKLPFLSTNRTRIFRIGRLQPLADALEVKRVQTAPPHDWTMIARQGYSGRRSFKRRLTNAAHVVVGVPTPLSDAVKSLNMDL